MSDVTMPQLGETVTEGTITKWFKKVGDRVARDELLFEVSTDKVDSEVGSPTEGVLVEIRVNEGDTVDVGSVLAVISNDASAVVAPAAPAPVAPAPAAPITEVAAPPVPSVGEAVIAAPVVTPAMPPVAAPAPATAAPASAPAASSAAASAPAAPIPARSTLSADTPGMDKVLSPVVRKLINENALDPAAILGTGPGGRITREDVLDAIDARNGIGATAAQVAAPVVAAPAATQQVPLPAAAPPAAPPIPAPTIAVTNVAAATPVTSQPVAAVPTAPVTHSNAAALPAVRPGGRDEVVALNNIRRRTGEHMVMSLQTAPHAFIAVEVDYSSIDKLRAGRKEAFKAEEGFSLTYLPFIARAVVDAITSFPLINASVAGDSLIVHKSVHLGVAVDLDFNGLMVPVVRDADGKRMRAIARDIADLASRARSKKLTPDDITGGTFTLSNAGPFGIDLMQSIINQPQSGILSITSVKKKPVVLELPDGSDTIAIRPMGMLGLSWDHRAFDGAYAASFLHEIKKQLEGKEWGSEL
jgi:pyruvate dehydrogenase E2 component (dihydrolipoamide acetyltransferase)